MYRKLDKVKIFTIIQALSELKQGNLSTSMVFNRLLALWNDLKWLKKNCKG